MGLVACSESPHLQHSNLMQFSCTLGGSVISKLGLNKKSQVGFFCLFQNCIQFHFVSLSLPQIWSATIYEESRRSLEHFSVYQRTQVSRPSFHAVKLLPLGQFSFHLFSQLPFIQCHTKIPKLYAMLSCVPLHHILQFRTPDLFLANHCAPPERSLVD